jgi:hypothetical protein
LKGILVRSHRGLPLSVAYKENIVEGSLDDVNIILCEKY